jgi:pSer/pThr/pTyr-binding forkhead associated (FHA) protein
VRTEGDDERSEAGVPVAARLVLGRREVALTLGEHVLGRSPEAVVWIDSDSVSRRHARIAVTGAGASIEDLGSKNGTYVNGVRVGGSRPLADGDELRIGSVRMLFRQFSGPPSTASEAADPDGGTGPS